MTTPSPFPFPFSFPGTGPLAELSLPDRLAVVRGRLKRKFGTLREAATAYRGPRSGSWLSARLTGRTQSDAHFVVWILVETGVWLRDYKPAWSMTSGVIIIDSIRHHFTPADETEERFEVAAPPLIVHADPHAA